MYMETIMFALVICNFILSVLTLFVRNKGVKIAETALDKKYTKAEVTEACNQAFEDGINHALDELGV